MKRLIALGIFGGFLFFSLTIWAQVPKLMDYHGRLTDERGRRIRTATPVRFSIYQGGDASTAGSGTLVYQENATVTPDRNGEFSHLIGSGTLIYGTLDSTVFQTADPVYLEITVDPGRMNFTLLPRKQIVTVGYSFKAELAEDADTVDGQDASAFAPVVHNHDADYVNEGQTDSVSSSMIVNGTIMDADINSSANIKASKINRSGLDADLLDGKDSEDFVHTAGDDMTGTLSVTTGTTFALSAESSNSNGRGVYGYATATSGNTFGVYGQSDSTSGFGVYGIANATSGRAIGVAGGSSSTNGTGVHGSTNATTGTTYGVVGYGMSSNARGVYGYASANSGVTYGVYGLSDSTNGRAIYGWASATSGTNYGVYGSSSSSSGYAVYGKNTAGGYGGYFVGKVHISGNLTVEGSKPCVQPIDNGKKVLLYAMESPEIWFEDFGSGKLVNGQAVVQLESVFAQAANTEAGYMVFLTPIGEWKGLYISRKDNNSFEVREMGDGTSNISFDYRIVAKRRGYEEVRFEEFTDPEQPPAEPNLRIERKDAKLKQPQRP